MTDSSAPNSMSAAAQVYQQAMEQRVKQQPGDGSPSTQSPALAPDMSRDVAMNDVPELAVSPAPALVNNVTPNAPSPVPTRTGTPVRGGDSSSRATSQHPDPLASMPSEARPHGAPVRQYLNGKVTTVLLEGMKMIAKEQDPLRVLGEYLIQKSKEIENS